MASNPKGKASNPIAMASNLIAMASNLVAMEGQQARNKSKPWTSFCQDTYSPSNFVALSISLALGGIGSLMEAYGAFVMKHVFSFDLRSLWIFPWHPFLLSHSFHLSHPLSDPLWIPRAKQITLGQH